MSERFVNLRYSPDGGYNWSDWRLISVGEVGDFAKRVQELRFGRGTEWVFEFMVTDNFRCDALAASWLPEVAQR